MNRAFKAICPAYEHKKSSGMNRSFWSLKLGFDQFHGKEIRPVIYSTMIAQGTR